ncbi:MAG: ornithine cyclodeaminase [Alphaproteobacteria bacterium]|nr:ornithine cyclodeaminase [Alphaproteobacteria bacterium]
MGDLLIISRAEVAAHLTYSACIPLMREAMTALSRGDTQQSLRTIIDLAGGRAFGIMPGALSGGTFGAKLISVYPGNNGTPSHQGVVTLFDPDNGAPVAIVDASEVTGIRTAAASAAATDALARPDSRRLAILGTGEQGLRHAEAIAEVRALDSLSIWGRAPAKAKALKSILESRLGCPVEVMESVEDAVRNADIVCTTTASPEPILLSRWVRDGIHVNAIGSSRAGPAEIDAELVRRAHFFADHREGVLHQGGEFIRAREAGLVGDCHIRGEIGEVFAGTLTGRPDPEAVTVYKSLGSVVQDLAAGWYLFAQAKREGFGTSVVF